MVRQVAISQMSTHYNGHVGVNTIGRGRGKEQVSG